MPTWGHPMLILAWNLTEQAHFWSHLEGYVTPILTSHLLLDVVVLFNFRTTYVI
jgi:hypothetical protein